MKPHHGDQVTIDFDAVGNLSGWGATAVSPGMAPCRAAAHLISPARSGACEV